MSTRVERPYLCQDCYFQNGKVVLCKKAKELYKKYGTGKKYQEHFKKQTYEIFTLRFLYATIRKKKKHDKYNPGPDANVESCSRRS